MAPSRGLTASASLFSHWGTRLPMGRLRTAWVVPSMTDTDAVSVLASTIRLRGGSAHSRSGPAPLTSRFSVSSRSTAVTRNESAAATVTANAITITSPAAIRFMANPQRLRLR